MYIYTSNPEPEIWAPFCAFRKRLICFRGGSWARRSPEMQKLHNCQGEEILIVKLFDNGET